ncbi:MAG: hypothetical protein AAGB12_09410 [Pseudomonadota bacterium]
MSAKIYDFPVKPKLIDKKIEEIVDDKLDHPNPKVLAMWRRRVKSILKNYQSEPFHFAVNVPADVTDEQLEQITHSIQITLTRYQKAMNRQKYQILNELCLLECRLCEYELNEENSTSSS